MEMHGMHGNARLKVNQCMLRWIVSGEHLSAGSCGLGILGFDALPRRPPSKHNTKDCMQGYHAICRA